MLHNIKLSDICFFDVQRRR